MRKLDKLKPQARAALGIKNIRSWMGYDDTVDLDVPDPSTVTHRIDPML